MIAIRETKVAIPPLENGDRLTRDEFEVRYAAMPELKKAELIDGVVYLASSVRVNQHGVPHSDLITWLGTYRIFTPGVMVCDNSTVRLMGDNEPQPDALMRLDDSKGGKSRITEDDYIEGPPELALEIAGSSASYDLHDKKEAYRRNGVQEYIVWNSGARSLSWFALRSDAYIALEPDESGIIRSQVFPGLWLNVKAFVANDLTQVYETLQIGLADESHQDFIKKLN